MKEIIYHLAFGYTHGGAFMLTGSIALAWVVLTRGILWKKEDILRNLAQFVVMFYLLWWEFSLPIILFKKYISIVWISLHALTALIYVAGFSDGPRHARLFLWCSLYAGICCLSTIGGQIQFLCVHYQLTSMEMSFTVSKVFYVLMIPLAMFLRHFNFGKFRAVPRVGYVLVLTCALSIFMLTAVEMPWMKLDYRIVITLLTGVLCVFSIMLVGVFAIYTLCKEQNERMDIQQEQQRLHRDQERSKAMEATLDDLRCIRHDLKNQYSYIQMLLQSGRQDEALAYLEQMSENMRNN